jgi:hypothetical protein
LRNAEHDQLGQSHALYEQQGAIGAENAPRERQPSRNGVATRRQAGVHHRFEPSRPDARTGALSRVEAMTDQFIPYNVILNHGLLSPAEDLETAIIAAAQSEASGNPVARIERGEEVILEGEKLRNAIEKHARDRLAESSLAG